MTEIKFINHNSAKILLEDFSNSKPGEAFNASIDQARQLIQAEPKKSVLALFDATGARFNKDTLVIMKDFTSANTPYIKAVAVVGITGMLSIALNAITAASKRNMTTFDTREEALDWLAKQ